MKKKRKIIWHRLFIVVLTLSALLIGICFLTVKTFNFIKEKQKENRESIKHTVFKDGYRYDLDFNQFNKFLIEKELPSIEEFREEINKIEKEKEPEKIYLGSFLLTGYCNCEVCCGQWAGGPCANGEMPVEGYTVAVDSNVIPLNSFVWIDGVRYKAQDTGSAIIGNHIDVFVEEHDNCYADWCNGYHDVYLEVSND